MLEQINTLKISKLRMEILDKKSNRMSRVIVGVSEANLLAILESLNELVHLEFLTDPKLQRILDFLSLRNLLSNELFLNISNNLYRFSNSTEILSP